jgi:hypothetical protein
MMIAHSNSTDAIVSRGASTFTSCASFCCTLPGKCPVKIASTFTTRRCRSRRATSRRSAARAVSASSSYRDVKRIDSESGHRFSVYRTPCCSTMMSTIS